MGCLSLLRASAQSGPDVHPVMAYVPPTTSASIVAPIRFESATPFDATLHQRFQDCDDHDLCDGKTVNDKCSTDPSRNTVFLKMPDGTVFFDAKMAIDAD